VDTGFRKTSCSSNNLKRDGDSKKSHHALGGSKADIDERCSTGRRFIDTRPWIVAAAPMCAGAARPPRADKPRPQTAARFAIIGCFPHFAPVADGPVRSQGVRRAWAPHGRRGATAQPRATRKRYARYEPCRFDSRATFLSFQAEYRGHGLGG